MGGAKYRRLVWQCNNRYGVDERCGVRHIGDDQLRRAFLVAFNAVLGNKAEIISTYREVIEALTDVTALAAEHEALEVEMEVTVGLIRQSMAENAKVALNQEEYQKRHDAPMARLDTAGQRRSEIAAERMARTAKRAWMEAFVMALQALGAAVTEFDEEMWYTTVDCVHMEDARGAVFIFKDSTEYAVPKEKWKV